MIRAKEPPSDRKDRSGDKGNNEKSKQSSERSSFQQDNSSRYERTMDQEDKSNSQSELSEAIKDGSLDTALDSAEEFSKNGKVSTKTKQAINKMSFYKGPKTSGFSNMKTMIGRSAKVASGILLAADLAEDISDGSIAEGIGSLALNVFELSAMRANAISAFLSPSKLGEGSYLDKKDFDRIRMEKQLNLDNSELHKELK